MIIYISQNPNKNQFQHEKNVCMKKKFFVIFSFLFVVHTKLELNAFIIILNHDLPCEIILHHPRHKKYEFNAPALSPLLGEKLNANFGI